MSSAAASYRRTVIASGFTGLVLIAIALIGQPLAYRVLPTPIASVGLAIAWALAAGLLLVALAGVVVLTRHARRERGGEDVFLALNKSRSEEFLRNRTGRSGRIPFAAVRRLFGAPAFVVGDTVRVRSLAEVAATLDERGCLDGLPFMPEMARYCGSVGTVYRCVDKIYDYGGRKDMRRIRDAVVITGLRCDGGAHDGCQAGCAMIWKTAWLEPADAPVSPVERDSVPRVRFGPTSVDVPGATVRKYVCQFTELVKASSEMSASDPRQDLRPLIAGNVTVTAFAVAMLTRLFNVAQKLRGGAGYPSIRTAAKDTSPRVDLGLRAGEPVRVASADRIFGTLDRSGRNRGLWFDRDMLKHCGGDFRVLRRVDRIIDDATGRMLELKTSCIVLDGLDASGEFLRFCGQQDYPFWREAWLERAGGKGESRIASVHEPAASASQPE